MARTPNTSRWMNSWIYCVRTKIWQALPVAIINQSSIFTTSLQRNTINVNMEVTDFLLIIYSLLRLCTINLIAFSINRTTIKSPVFWRWKVYGHFSLVWSERAMTVALLILCERWALVDVNMMLNIALLGYAHLLVGKKTVYILFEMLNNNREWYAKVRACPHYKVT